jgi:hypothetical protein
MDVLLKSIPIYTNQEEIQRLQLEPNAETLVADQISAVVNELASELLASVATELASPNVHGCIKDLTKAEELRTSGNAFFAKGKYLAAVAKFSESLRFLPPLEAETYAKVLCNRALCLSKLKLHKLAEYDSTEAIAIKPDHAKAFYRRAIAHRDQNNLSSAKSDAQRAVKLLEEQTASTEEAEALLTSLLEKCKIDAGGGDGLQKNEPMWTTTHSVPQDLWNDDNDESTKTTPNSAAAATNVPLNWSCSLPEISKLTEARTLVDPKTSLKLAESPKLGRHLVVNNPKLEENTDIILDQPVAHVLEKHQRLHRCGHCCKELPLGGAYFWPCTACSIAVFCSRECRDENVHHVAGGPECGVPWTALLPPEAVLAVRLASRLKRDQGNDNSSSSNNSSSVGGGAASKVVSSLQTCFSEIDTEEAIWRATMACAAHAAYTIAYQRSLKAPATTSTPFSIADIVRALGIIKINGLAITPPVFGSKEDSVGIAIYPISSFLSHSCATANVSVRFEGTTAIIRTLSALEAGTPLLHCYGPQAGEMTTKQRRMMLKDQYHFYCECDGCVVRSDGGTGTDKNEEVEKEAEMVGLRCSLTKGCLGAIQVPVCSSSVPGSSSIDAGIASKYDLSIEDEEKNSVRVVGCTKCGKVLSEVDWNTKIAPCLAKALECYSTGCRMLEMAEEEHSNKEIEKAVKLLEESLKIRQELLHKHNQVLGATHNALSWVEEEYNSKKHSNKIIHLKACLEIAERLFPAESTNIAFERLKLGTLLQQSESKDDIKQGKDLVSAAMITLERYFGNAAAAVTDENL